MEDIFGTVMGIDYAPWLSPTLW